MEPAVEYRICPSSVCPIRIHVVAVFDVVVVVVVVIAVAVAVAVAPVVNSKRSTPINTTTCH